jgi:hypothetical protein
LAQASALGGHHHVVAVAPLLDQRWNQLRRMLAVAIHAQHRVATRRGQARRQRGLLAEIARQVQQLHVAVGAALLEARHHLIQVVAAAVIDDHQFPFDAALRQHVGQARQQGLQRGGLVQHG